MKITSSHIARAQRAISFALLMKGIIGGSLTMLALAGVIGPHVGVDPSVVHQGTAATIGAVLGAGLALRG